MKKIIKTVLIYPIYFFLLIEGFFGGTTNKKDIWDDLVKWAKK